jgi:hypothetical protein
MRLLTKEPTQPPGVAADGNDPPKALFPEAEHHQRFRRTRLVLLAAVLAVAGIAYFVTAAVTRTPSAPVQLRAQAFAHSALAATESARSARISLAFEDQPRPNFGCAKTEFLPRARYAVQRAVVTTFRGEIDLATSTLSLAGNSATCGSKTPPFCSFPSQMVETTAAQYNSTTYQGTSCWTVPTGSKRNSPRKEVISRGPVASKPWSEVPVSELAEFVGVNDLPMSARPLAVVSVLTGRVMKIGPSEVNGTPATEYTGTTTLAAIQRIAGFHPVLTSRQGSLAPASASIRVRETIWLDARGRILQLVASEPLFTAIQRSGSSETGATQVFSTMVSRGGHLFQHNYALAKLDLSNFGARVRIAVPPQSEVFQPQR